ncbi:MAG TPA: ABC transporter permease, partial [Chloroflexota bacterium]|nr:ABC transporter permease [Chloroflexota bacterium]
MATKAVAIGSARVVDKKKDVGQISQWTLMRRRFMENKLSVVGGIVLIVMYLTAAFASFVAPYSYEALDSNSQFAAPTPIYMVNGRPSVCGVTQTLNSATLTWVYQIDCNNAYPIKLFVQGWSYSLFGLFPTDIHLFGVDDPAKIYVFGVDGQGRDLLSRVLEGSRISLTIGLLGVAIAVV